MHLANVLWLGDLKHNYPWSFQNTRVLDLGSLDINGSARPWFKHCDYIGIDQKNGPSVDVVCKMVDTNFDKKFDVIISLNCFMHDLDWENSLKHNLQWLKKGGLFFASFGDVPRYYPDWIHIPVDEFCLFCEMGGLQILDGFYESERYPLESLANRKTKGMFNLVAEKL